MADFSKIKTYPIARRRNLVTLKDLKSADSPVTPFESPELREVAEAVAAARMAGRTVILMMGAHVIKCGLGPVLADLVRRGVVTHVASNGAAAIHDFEIALIGETSEDVGESLVDGSFGMAEETGALMNRAARQGVRDGLGFGESLGRMIAEEGTFRFREHSLLYNVYSLGIPFTVHVAIGTDIINQHPVCDFAALGEASGRDFKSFTDSVSRLEGGVFLNLGSAVAGPEVFLKALSISRNLGFKVERFTTANFDLRPIQEPHRPRRKDEPDYYYRPLKNIVVRPTLTGGKGFHVAQDHALTIPNLRRLVIEALNKLGASIEPARGRAAADAGGLDPPPKKVLDEFCGRTPELGCLAGEIGRAFRTIDLCFRRGGTLFLCGNGGSFADALHVSGELMKSYRIKRPVSERRRRLFSGLPGGEAVAASLEEGLRCVVLGANHSLSSAVENDNPARGMAFAQELFALARTGDTLLAISTSGNAGNVVNAAVTARALGLPVVALTGEAGGRLAEVAGVAIKAPAGETGSIQELHSKIYHALCAMLEAALCRRLEDED